MTIPKVTFGQGVLAAVKATAAFLVLTVGGCGGCLFLIGKAGKNIPDRMTGAVRRGQTLQQLLAKDSKFSQYARKKEVVGLKLLRDDDNPHENRVYITCRDFRILPDGLIETDPHLMARKLASAGTEPSTWLTEHKADVAACDQLAVLRNDGDKFCSFTYSYDKAGVITQLPYDVDCEPDPGAGKSGATDTGDSDD